MATVEDPKIGCVVKGSGGYVSKQGSVYAPGISAETAGSKVVFLGIVRCHLKAAPRRTSTNTTSLPST